MTAYTAAPTTDAASGGAAALPAWLAGDLQERLERAAAAAGVSVSEACGQWVREGLENFEARQAAAEAAGRCSLRTGTVTVGPVPLPVQQ
jgi:hypothetical protein